MSIHNTALFDSLLAHEVQDATWRPQRTRPIVLERGKGSHLQDVEGKTYLDLVAGFGALPLGHQHPSLVAALSNISQLGLLHQGLGDVHPHISKLRLLEKMHSLLPVRLTRTALAVTGAQAVETAIKSALLRTGGKTIIAFKRAYHGLDFGALETTSRDFFRIPFQKWLNHERVRHLEFASDLNFIEKEAKSLGSSLAGILVEPIQGRGGFHVASIEWLQGLAAIAKRCGVPLILDEVMTGLGRCGRITFADVVDADIICLGKALGGGMPISACVGTEDVMSFWPVNTSEAIHTGTFFGHPLSCEVAYRTLSVIEEESLAQKTQRVGDEWMRKAYKRLSSSAWIKDIRGSGLMIGVEFCAPGLGARAMEDLQGHGIISIPCGESAEALGLTPALNIEEIELERALDALKIVIEKWT